MKQSFFMRRRSIDTFVPVGIGMSYGSIVVGTCWNCLELIEAGCSWLVVESDDTAWN
jgi:hypothetical protein